MSSQPDDEQLVRRIRALLSATVERLAAAGVPDEALAEFIPPRRVLVFTRDAVMRPIGRVWRLGVFLLDHEAALFGAGGTTRAVPPGHPGYQSISAENRRGYRAAAFRGRFERGETVNFDARPIALDAASLRDSTGPLFVRDDTAFVRWSPAAPDDAAIPFDAYLAERVDLLLNPPQGAG